MSFTLVFSMITDYLFLPSQITPVQINRVGEAVVEPLEDA
jgi:hypothetical protein